MGNLFYDEPRIEGKFKPGDRVRLLSGFNAGRECSFIEYNGHDRNDLAYNPRSGPNPECYLIDPLGRKYYFAESDLELIAVQETQHEQPAAEPSPSCTPLNPTGNPRYQSTVVSYQFTVVRSEPDDSEAQDCPYIR